MKRVALFLSIILLYSCDIQKRRYTGGYYIDWMGIEQETRQDNSHRNKEKLSAEWNGVELQIRSDIELNTSGGISYQPILPAPLIPLSLDHSADISTPQEISDIEPRINAVESTVPKRTESITRSSHRTQKRKNIDWWALGLGLASLASLGGIWRFGRSRVLKLSNWASKNQGKAIAAIAAIQLSAVGSGLVIGHSLDQMGMDFSRSMWFATVATMLVGFGLVPFIRRFGPIFRKQTMRRYQLGFMLASIAGFGLATYTGNTADTRFQDTLFLDALEHVDQTLFGSSDGEEFQESNTRPLATAGMTFGAFMLIVISVILLCAGICMLLFAMGIWGGFEPGTTIMLILGGGLAIYLAILGFRAADRIIKRKPKQEEEQA